jgi:hypothetical protein
MVSAAALAPKLPPVNETEASEAVPRPSKNSKKEQQSARKKERQSVEHGHRSSCRKGTGGRASRWRPCQRNGFQETHEQAPPVSEPVLTLHGKRGDGRRRIGERSRCGDLPGTQQRKRDKSDIRQELSTSQGSDQRNRLRKQARIVVERRKNEADLPSARHCDKVTRSDAAVRERRPETVSVMQECSAVAA